MLNNGRSEEIANRLAPGGSSCIDSPNNVGLGRNWNTCVQRSRGHWIHILHQDDLVLPGYYETMERSVRDRPDIGAAFCRHAYINGRGERTSVSELEIDRAGVLEDWLEKIAVGRRIECPSIAVRRTTYEQLGGFNPELYFALDWEMWVRIAAHFPVWYEPEILACFRRHDASETNRVDRAGSDLLDVVAAVELVSQHVPPNRRSELHREAVRQMRWRYLRHVGRLMEANRCVPAVAYAWRAYQDEDLATRSKAMFVYSKWAIKVALRSFISRVPGRDAARTSPGAADELASRYIGQVDAGNVPIRIPSPRAVGSSPRPPSGRTGHGTSATRAGRQANRTSAHSVKV